MSKDQYKAASAMLAALDEILRVHYSPNDSDPRAVNARAAIAQARAAGIVSNETLPVTNASEFEGPATLNKLRALLGDEFANIPLRIMVTDGSFSSESVECPTSLWEMPRSSEISGSSARLAFRVHLNHHKLVKLRK
jgi:hypothetical protein